MPTVGIIGAGLIGRSWAMVFARAKWDVKITDTNAMALESAPGLVKQALADQAKHGLVEDAKAVLKRVAVAPTLAAAVSGVDFVQECGPEKVEDKVRIFKQLDADTPAKAIIASSSSAIVASKYTEKLAGRHRCLVAHPVNPPHLVPLVELCPAPWTSEETVAKARKVYERIGQVPILVKKEIEGFILNRLQGALLAEAFRLVGEGYCSAEDLDKTIRDGLGHRWSFMGPFETIELNAPGGIADYCERYTGFYKRLQAEPATPAVYASRNTGKVAADWGEPLSREQHASKTRWRDERLATLVAHKRGQKGFKP